MALNLDRTARLARGQRFFDQRAVGMSVRQQPSEDTPDRVSRQRVLHRRIAEQQFARGVEQRNGVFEVLHGRLQVGLLSGQQGPIGRQLLADGVEEITQFSEFVTRRQIERDAELTFPKTRQTAAKDVNRPQEKLGKDSGNENGDRQGRGRRKGRVVQQIAKLPPHQEGGDPDSDRAEVLASPFERLSHLEGLSVSGEDHPQLVERRVLDDRLQIGALGQRPSCHRPVVVHDDGAARIDDRREADVVAVDARLENRVEARILAQRHIRIDVAGDDASRPVEDGLGEHLTAGQALLEHHVGKAVRVERAERHHRHTNDGCHADDLLDSDAQTHGSQGQRSKVKGQRAKVRQR